ncbi:hypothetical protein [Deinococcus sp.]|uniref:hypothetical protein n=1 Tax=Deinococcus sp. TaxID=47478 RepID=UPI003C7C774E
MTTREEAKAKIDALSDSAFEEVLKVIDEKARLERHLAALDAFAEGWTPEQAASFEAALSHRVQLNRTEDSQS